MLDFFAIIPLPPEFKQKSRENEKKIVKELQQAINEAIIPKKLVINTPH